MSRYVVLIDGKKGAYGAIVPDLPGCTAMGSTVEDVLANTASAMRDWAEVTEESGGDVPPPRPIEAIAAEPDMREALVEGAVMASVPLIRETGRPVKANLSLDAGILAAIDDEARRRKLTRSALIEAIAKTALIDG